MKYAIDAFRGTRNFFSSVFFIALSLCGCKQHEESLDKRIKQMDPAKTAALARSIDSLVKPELADSLTLRLWGIDSLVISPVAIDIDDSGKLYYATTNRQKNSEFDIRGHLAHLRSQQLT